MRGLKMVLPAVLLVVLATSAWPAGNLQPTTGTTAIRASAAPTTSDVAATTAVVVNNNYDAIHVYATVDLTGGTNVTLTPAGNVDNATTPTYYMLPALAQTYTADGSYAFRIPRESVSGHRLQVYTKATGTTLSTCRVSLAWKPEQ